MAEQQTRHRFAVALNIRGANQIRARALSDRPKQSGTDQLNAQGHWSGKIRSVDAIVSADTNQLETPQLRRPAPVRSSIRQLLHRPLALHLCRAVGLERNLERVRSGNIVEIEVLPSATQKIKCGRAVGRFGERARLARHHLMRVRRWRIGLRENSGSEKQGNNEQSNAKSNSKEPGGSSHRASLID